MHKLNISYRPTGILGRVIVLELLKRGKKYTLQKRKIQQSAGSWKSFQFYTETPNEYFDSIEWIEVDFEDIHSLQNALNGVEGLSLCR